MSDITNEALTRAILKGVERKDAKRAEAEELRRLERERIAQATRNAVDDVEKNLADGALLDLVENTLAKGEHYALVSTLDPEFAQLTGGKGYSITVLAEAIGRFSRFTAEQTNQRQLRIMWRAEPEDEGDTDVPDSEPVSHDARAREDRR